MASAAGVPPYRKGTAVLVFLAATLIVMGAALVAGYRVDVEAALVAMLVGVVASVGAVAGIYIYAQRQGPRHAHDDPLHTVKRIEEHHRAGRLRCLNCGFENPPQAERCASCDHELIHICKKCKTRVRLDWNACPECGTVF